MGGSQSREDLEKANKQLATTTQQKQQLESDLAALKAKLDEQADALQTTQNTLAVARASHTAELDALTLQKRDAERKQKEAEEGRRNDAVLCKRIMHAQLRHLGKAEPSVPASLAADDAVSQVLQVRQMLVHTANELKSSQAHAATLEADALATRRTELQRALWLPEMSDVSFSLRSASGAILAGVKLPRAGGSALGGPRAGGLSPSVAVYRHLGSTSASGPYTAIGGALLWDAERSEVAAMRLAMCAQPFSDPKLAQLSMSFDHTGSLSGSVKAQPLKNGSVPLTARLFGTLDLNQKGMSRVGLEMAYDLPSKA